MGDSEGGRMSEQENRDILERYRQEFFERQNIERL